MEIQYVLINFLLLVGILFLFARKTIIKIFCGRRERINSQLDEAELIENSTAPVFEEPVFESIPFEESAELLQEKAEAEAKIEQIRSFGLRECSEIHRGMIETVRKQYYQVLKYEVRKLFSEEPYLTRLRDKEMQMVDDILGMIKLTPGDMNYLRMHNILYVTLTSAHPLEYDIIKKVDQATKELLAAVNGKTSLWIREDPELIGGLRLRIGDTVYDATVAEELYQLEQRVSREPITTDETARELLREFGGITNSFEPKVEFDEDVKEIMSLIQFQGENFCKLYEYSLEDKVYIMERIIPADTLYESAGRDERIKIVGAIFKVLHKPGLPDSIFPTYTEWFEAGKEGTKNRKDCEELRQYLESAESMLKDICRKYSRNVLLHGDLHHENILKNENGSYTVIDPKGVAGDPVFDLSRFILDEFRDDLVSEPKNVIIDLYIETVIWLFREELANGESLEECEQLITNMKTAYELVSDVLG